MNNGGPAFPYVSQNDSDFVAEGMTLRDYFAAKAMAALIIQNETIQKTYDKTATRPTEITASMAYMIADAMLKERENAPAGADNAAKPL